MTTLTTGWPRSGRWRLGRSLAHRFRLLGWAYANVLSGIAGLVLLGLMLVGSLLLAVLPVGAPMVLAAVRLTRRFVDAHRWIVGSTLVGGIGSYGTAAFDPSGLRASALTSHSRGGFPGVYQRWPPGRLWRQSLALLREPATWQDAAWLLVNGTVGLIASGLVAAAFAVSVHSLSLPLQFAAARAEQVAATSAPGHDYLGIGVVESQAMSFVGIPVGLAGLLLWWWITPRLLRRYALLSRLLLGSAGTIALTGRVREVINRDNQGTGAGGAERQRIGHAQHGNTPQSVRTLAPRPQVTAGRRSPFSTLTSREQEVLALIAEGRTNAAIAARLFITEKAVDKHVNNLFRKLELTVSGEDNRRVLAALAYHETTRRGGL